MPILRGWRRQLAGELLLQVLDGAVTITVDRTSGALRMTTEKYLPRFRLKSHPSPIVSLTTSSRLFKNGPGSVFPGSTD